MDRGLGRLGLGGVAGMDAVMGPVITTSGLLGQARDSQR
jgi:hypothetical protein